MARKPNYQFERQERQRQKAAKKAAKKEKAELANADNADPDLSEDDLPTGNDTSDL